MADPLAGVEAYLFDVFGTVVDWYGSVSRSLKESAPASFQDEDWGDFTKEWRKGYMEYTRRVSAGGPGSNNADIMHREILDEMFVSSKWVHLAVHYDDKKRTDLVNLWHQLHGWPDSSTGLHALKKRAIICTLSNGNVRLLVDLAKFSDLPWDVVFSGELLGSYKPNPKVYLGAIHHLSLPAEKCAMVAAHVYDLREAAAHGMKTVYVRRATEEPEVHAQIKSKAEGGEVDLVVDSFEEIVAHSVP
ncbi:haloacid dehalogenase [Epithele typhae]|uniref:haloacid dehalogenase n=1 Tax=Epithele typhae TaxID=378194 RepID=UPI00200812A1|nr:haloacid dehalogenase [Epithele typhae]KAH9920511.1 haloacid dehalogenase [Epithele typhae]